MTDDSYSIEDLFDSNEGVLPTSATSDEKKTKFLTDQDKPLVLTELAPTTREIDSEEKREERIKRKSEQEELEEIQKEIESARKELIKTKPYDYREVTPRLLRSMVVFYQTEALLGRNPGLRCDQDTSILLFPIIEHDGQHEIVVLRAPIIGCLERHQIFVDSQLFKIVKDYYEKNHQTP